MPDPAAIPPLRLVVPETVQKQIDETTDWLETLSPPFGGEEAAARFSLALDREMPTLCQDIAERLVSGSNLPRPDGEASIAFARPTFRHVFTTATGRKRRRGQTAGVWFLFYTLPGGNILRVMKLRHSAGESLTAQFDRPFATDDAND